jgi:hypothetical protein
MLRRCRDWRGQPVELRHVAKRHLRFFILWYTREDARDDFLGMGPDRIVMWIVVAPTLGYQKGRCMHQRPVVSSRIGYATSA